MCTAPFRVIRLMSLPCQKGIVAPRLCPCSVSRFHHKSTAATALLRNEWRVSFLTIGLPLLATLVGAGLAVFAVVGGG